MQDYIEELIEESQQEYDDLVFGFDDDEGFDGGEEM